VSASEPVAGTAARRARREAEAGAGAGAQRPGSLRDRSESPGPGPAVASRRRLDPDELAALEEERDFLLRSLRDLEREHDAGDVDEHDYESLRDDYTARAAAVLRAIESRQAALAAGRPAPRPGRRALVGAAVLVVAALLGVAVAQASGRRGAGGEITGDVRQTARDKALDARQAMGEGRFMDAVGLFDEVERLSPSDVEAYAYKGWLLVITARQAPAGPDRDLLRSRALAELDRAVEIDPTYPDARVFRAAARGDVGRPADGLADLAAVAPDALPVDLRPLVESLRSRLQQQAPPAG
jgi:hypothetical protein